MQDGFERIPRNALTLRKDLTQIASARKSFSVSKERDKIENDTKRRPHGRRFEFGRFFDIVMVDCPPSPKASAGRRAHSSVGRAFD